MTSPDTPPPRRRPRLVLIGVLLVVVGALWWVTELYTTDAARACREMYAGARTAVDSNRIDLIVPAAGRRLSEPRACVNYRRKFAP